MAKTVWKYELRPGIRKVEMPEGASLLHVGVQFDSPMLWALVDQICPSHTLP